MKGFQVPLDNGQRVPTPGLLGSGRCLPQGVVNGLEAVKVFHERLEVGPVQTVHHFWTILQIEVLITGGQEGGG